MPTCSTLGAKAAGEGLNPGTGRQNISWDCTGFSMHHRNEYRMDDSQCH